MPTHLELARKDVHSFFENHAQQVFKRRQLEKIVAEHRDAWRLAQNTSFEEFLTDLLKSRKLREFEFAFPHRKETRYTWGDVPLEPVLLTLKKGCHFSHFTAAQLHELTEQDPKTIYLNHEQPPKPPPAAGLAQERIDQAFRRKPRTTGNVASLHYRRGQAVRVCLLNGKHTGYLGVVEREVRLHGEGKAHLRLTDVERTLIDVTVRPFYGGGIGEVLNMYRRAATIASVNRLAGMLRKLGYVYPYHQAVGFYLEAAGVYDRQTLDLFHDRFEYEFDFYLAYGMQDTVYVPRWRIHVPRGVT
ncbi:MAG: hypothetical protein JXA69_10245 [Phycisphaerae bacterium]|nr:hypothetical protein [Phycisphaerae bacterium]